MVLLGLHVPHCHHDVDDLLADQLEIVGKIIPYQHPVTASIPQHSSIDLRLLNRNVLQIVESVFMLINTGK